VEDLLPANQACATPSVQLLRRDAREAGVGQLEVTFEATRGSLAFEAIPTIQENEDDEFLNLDCAEANGTLLWRDGGWDLVNLNREGINLLSSEPWEGHGDAGGTTLRRRPLTRWDEFAAVFRMHQIDFSRVVDRTRGLDAGTWGNERYDSWAGMLKNLG